jgi:hypothetical protein
LSLWSCNNPRAELGKELCDILIVCDPHIIIVSVKDVTLNPEKEQVGHERWLRKAVEASVRQIYGAEKVISTASQVVLKDGSLGLNLPNVSARKIHRIAVAFGSQGQVPISSGDFGKGFVHVMDEQSFFEVLTELDTITDLLNYLTAKETLLARCSVVIEGPESNLLGWYLYHERAFPDKCDLMVVDNTIWEGIKKEVGFQRRKEADAESYVWDRLIELLSDPNTKPISGTTKLNDLELALRVMARENRLSRRILGKALREFLEQAKTKTLRSRVLVSPNGIIYVFVFFSVNETPKAREAELGTRCLMARHKVGKGNIVIGIGLGEFQPGFGSSSDLIYLNMEDWSQTLKDAEKVMTKTGYFSGSPLRQSHEDEYPQK